MEKDEEFKIEVPSIQGFREWEDMCTDDEVDEKFASSLSSYLKNVDAAMKLSSIFCKSLSSKLKKI